ncbi:MAG: cation-transporting P-type ATPase [bacterium]|nr:cation-transporting P-type ATPase [bacterium]
MLSSTKWHSLPINKVFDKLDSSSKGLTTHAAESKLEHYGPNLISPKKDSILKKIIEPFTSIFVVVLLIAVTMSLFTGEKFDAIVIMVVIAINALIFYFQQYSSSKVLAGLKSKEDNEITVLRDGRDISILARYIVPGDVVYIFEGSKVPADGRIIDSNNLQINESLLTGEALPTTKQAGIYSDNAEIYDQNNMVFKGTFVHNGSGSVVICKTGSYTELGTISRLASESDFGKTPIEKKIDTVTKWLVFGVSVIGILVFGLALVRGIETTEALRFSLSLVVSVVPEGLPVTLTIVLLFSAKRMASYGALVKKLSSMETMGAITLIATDKTGTLTQNKLQISNTYDQSGKLSDSIRGSITIQNGVVLDSLDVILKEKYPPKKSRNQVSTFPFDQNLRVSGSLLMQNDKYILYIKGAPDAAFTFSRNAKREYVAEQTLSSFTKKGFRTIGFGHLVLSEPINKITAEHIKKATFDGFVALSDPIRPNIKKSVMEAKNAGINVVMLTGDHVNTAEEIARQAGIISKSSEVQSSEFLEKVPSKSKSTELLKNIHAFGRVLPKHKFNFVKALKNREVTTMTGDGVNDIPALVESDAGLAMGSGTDAAKDAADIVLLDDDFSTIVKAIKIGRSVIANIQKMLYYLISSSIGEAAAMIGALIFTLPLPVSAIQILWINIVTDGFTVLPLGLSKPEGHQMKQKPRDPNASLLPKYLVVRLIITGSVMAATSLLIFNHLLPKGYEYAQTATFISLVVAQWANVLNANHDKASWIKNLYKPSLLIWGGIALSIAFQAIVFIGPLRQPFGIVSISNTDLLLSIVAPIITVLIASDLHKLYVARAKA